ncbi:MAG: SLC13 family permease [Candidatus Thorarchaeota archaeon]
MDLAGLVIVIILVATLLIVLSEKINETAAVLFAMSLAGSILWFAYGFTFREFVLLMQWDTILFVTAMLIVVAVATSSGMFQYIALVLLKGTQGEPKRIFITFMGFVFVISLFLDPLPTMLVMGVFTVEVCKVIDLDFRPILISEVVVANFASIPSFVGSIPNLVIAVWAQTDVALMAVVLFPLSIILLIVTLFILLRWYGPQFDAEICSDWNMLNMVKPGTMIKSRRDFYLSIIAMSILVLAFTIGALRVEASLIAMMVASGMLVFTHERSEKLVQQLSWGTIFFLVGLFGLVAALERSGVIDEFVGSITGFIGNNIFLGMGFLIWIPGFFLSLIDNVPIAALLAPLGLSLGQSSANAIVPLTLYIGINVGGYMIPFGDAPNMIAVTQAKEGGRPISFLEFTKVALPLGFIHLVISTIYSFFVALLFI